MENNARERAFAHLIQAPAMPPPHKAPHQVNMRSLECSPAHSRQRRETRLRLPDYRHGQVSGMRRVAMLEDEDAEKSARVMKAMLQMEKIDIAGLKQAYDRG